MAHENQFRDILQGIQNEDHRKAVDALPPEVKERIAEGYLTGEERAERDRRYGLLGQWAQFEKDTLPKYKDAFTQAQSLQRDLATSQAKIADLEATMGTLRASSDAAGSGADAEAIQKAIAGLKDQIMKEAQAQFVTSQQLEEARTKTRDETVEFIHTRSIPVMRQADEYARRAKEEYGHTLDQEKLFETAKQHGNNLDLAYRLMIDPVREAATKAQYEKDIRAAEERGRQTAASEHDTKGNNPEDSSGGQSFSGFLKPGAPPNEAEKVPEDYVPGQGNLLGRAAAADYRKLMESGSVQ